MWAAFKSDLQEFASGAAEETNAVASKVGATLAGDADAAPGGGAPRAPPAATPGVDGSVLLAQAGLKGLQGAASLLRTTAAAVATKGGGGAARGGGAASGGPPGAAVSSMWAQAGEDEEEEEELGWDDDDEDLEGDEVSGDSSGVVVEAEDGKAAGSTEDFFEEQLGPTADGGEKQPPVAASSPDNHVLAALQAKLDAVEKARAALQSEHRGQTAELVELRAKVEELEHREDPPAAEAVASEGGAADEARALEEEIAQLKRQLGEQRATGELAQEHEKVVAGLVEEKASLERDLREQREHTTKILSHASPDEAPSGGDAQTLLLQEYEQHIQALAAQAHTLPEERAEQAQRTEQLLRQMQDYHALALKTAQESKAELAAVEEELRQVREEKEEVQAKLVRAAGLAVRLQAGTDRAAVPSPVEAADAGGEGVAAETPPATEDTTEGAAPAAASAQEAGGAAPAAAPEQGAGALEQKAAAEEGPTSSDSSPVQIEAEDELSVGWGEDGGW